MVKRHSQQVTGMPARAGSCKWTHRSSTSMMHKKQTGNRVKPYHFKTYHQWHTSPAKLCSQTYPQQHPQVGTNFSNTRILGCYHSRDDEQASVTNIEHPTVLGTIHCYCKIVPKCSNSRCPSGVLRNQSIKSLSPTR